LLGSADLFAARAEEPTERALRLIDDVGGVVTRDETAAGKPVVAVSLCGARLSDEVLKCLSTFPQLRTLDLCRTDGLTAKRIALLADLKALEALNVSRCPNVTGGELSQLEGLKNLRVLDVSYCTNLNNCGLGALVDSFPKLRSLDISGCKRVIAHGLEQLSDLTELEVLMAADCDFTDAAIREIAGLKGLRSLSVAGSPRTTVNGFKALAALEQLKVLDLSGCPDINDDAVKELTKLNKLEHLTLRGCKKVSASGAKVLTDALPKLKLDR
jgi:Leucine-rich repeat (LRR) protein